MAQEQWAALEAFYRAGKARAIGVANYCRDCLECLARNSTLAPMLNQVQYHVGMGADPSGLHSYCSLHGIQVTAYAVFAAGGGPVPSAGKGAVVKAAGSAHGKSGFQAALRWIVQKGIPVLVRAKPSQWREDLDVLGWGLTDAEMGRIDGVGGPGCADRKSPNAPAKCC